MDRTQGQAEPGERAAAGPGAHTAPGPVARVVTLTAGDYTLTVNPVDGSEIEPRRPGTGGGTPAKRDAAGRSAHTAAARPPALPGPAAPAPVLVGREEERERLVRLLGRGRSVRLTGPAGSGRTRLLDAVAADCAPLAPDGVVRLSGFGHQQPGELLYALHDAVYQAPCERPGRAELLARVRDIGAIVLLDDLEMGGAALDELLAATPECAYLLAATPDTRAPSDDSHLEEVFLTGLGRADCLRLLEARTGRPLTDAETAWAEDLRFASEGLPLRFVQAAALLRRRDELNRAAAADDDEEPGVFEERPRSAGPVPLPALAEAAAPAELLASRASESARAALRIACALGGELPHHAHLPALVGDTHADSAVAELLAAGLITPVGPRHRLAAGVARQLEEAGFGETAAEEARTAARHYAWWTGHSSVTPERVAAEADAVLAALAGADVVAGVLLARSAAPAFAASRHWEAWERVLRAGAEAARKAGEVAEQAYFHHELGVLALCEGRVDRARAELEASIGLKGALADKRGTVAGRRALALVTDREAAVQASPPLRLEAPAASAAGTAAVLPAGSGGAAGSRIPGGSARPGAASAAASPSAAAPAASGSAAPAAKPRPAAAPVASEAPTAALPASEAVTAALPATGAATTAVPVIRPAVAPASLSKVFEDAFPLDPKPAPGPVPASAPVPPPGYPAGPPAPARGPAALLRQRRKAVLTAAAGALTVAVLGTVVGLAMSPSGTQAPAGGSTTSSTPPTGTPSSGAGPTGTDGGGSDSAPQPATAPSPRQSGASAEPGQSAEASPTKGTPSRRPSPGTGPSTQSPPVTGPTASSPSPSQSPVASPTPSPPPTPTATTPPATATGTTSAAGPTSPQEPSPQS
ncbi:ATP-binding protein [Streptomyces sp. 2P-4]|uniref:ATP-binding protein n=1 Tax=Streptomyces sp. 2P-4 TaxID=2931974 RepID=UPI002541BB54|nr:ATP-binding protein [Streptomyces sp. 2P-4]